MTLATLVTGPSASARETAIAALLDSRCSTAMILEGLPDGTDPFARFSGVSYIQIKRIAPGCICCIGNLTMRVTLNRILRHPPERLYLSLAATNHLEEIRRFLTQPPYDALLELTNDLQA
jgi:hypothetical protein